MRGTEERTVTVDAPAADEASAGGETEDEAPSGPVH